MGFLIGLAAFTGAAHALAPDHWLPLSALASKERWSWRKIFSVTLSTAVLHVSLALVLGRWGLLVLESMRSNAQVVLLAAFGIGYALWCAKKRSARFLNGRASAWLVGLVALGPCEPLIPILFLSRGVTPLQVSLVCAVFFIGTTAVMLGMVFAASAATAAVRPRSNIWPSWMAGGLIALTAAFIFFLGL